MSQVSCPLQLFNMRACSSPKLEPAELSPDTPSSEASQEGGDRCFWATSAHRDLQMNGPKAYLTQRAAADNYQRINLNVYKYASENILMKYKKRIT